MLKKDEKPKTLEPEDIEEVERPTRRSAIALVGSLVTSAIVGAVISAPSEAEACRRRTGITDSDPSDGVGHGHTGLTDSDSGDEGRCGRGGGGGGGGRLPVYVRPRCTDNDQGRHADRPNHGRRCR